MLCPIELRAPGCRSYYTAYNRVIVRIRVWVAVFMVIAALGCREVRIDGSDPERARLSIVAARDSLPAERRAEFDRSLQILMRRGAEPPLLADARVRHQIDGKSASEIITAGDAVLRDEAQRRMDEKTKATIAEIHASFDRVDAQDPKMPPVDDDVRQFCAASPDPGAAHRCEWREMLAKQKFTGPLSKNVSADQARQIRTNCRNQGVFQSYGELAACQDRFLSAFSDMQAKMLRAPGK